MPGELPILLEVDSGLAVLRLNRPSVLNAIDVAMAEAFRAAIDRVAEADDVRALLLLGNGAGFCAGGDVAQFGPGADHGKIAGDTMQHFHPAILRLASLPLPTVAAVHGAVAGAGFALVLACDFAIAAETARFSLAYSRIGGTLDGASSWMLPRLLGVRKAKELALLSERLDAAEAARLGLVNQTVPEAELEAEGHALAQRLAEGPTVAYANIKALIDGAFAAPLARQLDAEREAFVEAAGTADFREGLSAFFDRREPRFLGK